MEDLINGRCGWAGTDDLYIKYHDEEWGKPVSDDKILFEFLVLESAQAGLSWITILRKREGYRKAFCNFDVNKVAQMTSDDVKRLMKFDGIVRNRLKIQNTLHNARLFIAIQQEFGSFDSFLLAVRGRCAYHRPCDRRGKPSRHNAALRPAQPRPEKRGFKFVGSTIVYSYMQAVGMVDDHTVLCPCHTHNRAKEESPALA